MNVATNNHATEIFAASILGTAAYQNGAKRVPHFDANLRAMMVGLQVGSPLMKQSKPFNPL